MISPQLRSELLQYLEYIHEQTEEKTIKKPVSETELVLGALACLQEESGELACEVRKFTKMNFNQSKVDNFLPEHLAEELADVLIVTLALGQASRLYQPRPSYCSQSTQEQQKRLLTYLTARQVLL
ncbi:MAG: MazG-like family protein [Candidatus Peribacteria bacterium]|nr:MAG: MazG-like family protein [Candidatus Peribacteria bacterium]